MFISANIRKVSEKEKIKNTKFLYTPTGAWHGKIYGMAWPYFFPPDAVHNPHTVQKDMNTKKNYK